MAERMERRSFNTDSEKRTRNSGGRVERNNGDAGAI